MVGRNLRPVLDSSDIGLDTGLDSDSEGLRIVASRLPVMVIHSVRWLVPDSPVGILHMVCGLEAERSTAAMLLERFAAADGSRATYGGRVVYELLTDAQLFAAVQRAYHRLREELAAKKQELCSRLADLHAWPEGEALFSWRQLATQAGPWLFCPFASDAVDALGDAGIRVAGTGFLSIAAAHDIPTLAEAIRDAVTLVGDSVAEAEAAVAIPA